MKFRVYSRLGSRRGVAAALLALFFLSTGCFQDQPKSHTSRAVALGPESIWPLNRAGSQAPAVRSVAADDLFFASEMRDYQRAGTDVSSDPFAVYSPYSIASQASLIRTPEVYRVGGDRSFTGTLRSAPFTRSSESAAAIFNKPFGLLFASIFKKSSDEPGAAADAGAEDNRNPFRDAKLSSKSVAAAAPAKAETAPPSSTATDSTTSTQTDPKADASSAPNPVSAPAAPEPRYLFLGDFDGSGILKVMRAIRLGDNSFSFSDGQRNFSLFTNPAAVDLQRSMAIDDINGDGIADLLVTSRASLFGGVLLGDGTGDFRLADSFLTAYEPTVATTGPSFNGIRDIVTLNARTGSVATFRAADRYRPFRMLSLDFVPDYVGRLVSRQSGLDYLMAARSGNPEILYSWQEDGRLENAGQSLPGDPSVSFAADPLSQSLAGVLQVYQVGTFASVTLANSRGQSFNVANMKIWPNVFIAIGDLSNQGTLDVAAAFLISSTPNK